MDSTSEDKLNLTVFEYCKNHCIHPVCAIRGNGIVNSAYMKAEVQDCIKSHVNLSK